MWSVWGCLRGLTLTAVSSKRQALRKPGFHPGMIPWWIPREGCSWALLIRSIASCSDSGIFHLDFYFLFKVFFFTLLSIVNRMGFFVHLHLLTHLFYSFMIVINRLGKTLGKYKQAEKIKSQTHCIHSYWYSPNILSIHCLKFYLVTERSLYTALKDREYWILITISSLLPQSSSLPWFLHHRGNYFYFP